MDKTIENSTIHNQMTAEAFRRWEHTGIAEWVDGVVFQMPVTYEHQTTVSFLNRLIGMFVQAFGLGTCHSVRYSMRLRQGQSMREPDLMFVSQAHAQQITSGGLEGPADLIIEVVSTESVARDYDDKYQEYQDGGVREYWIIDSRPDRQRVSFFVLDERGKYRPVPPDANVYRSTVLANFWLKTDWLWQAPSPPIEALLLEIGGDAYIQYLTTLLKQHAKSA